MVETLHPDVYVIERGGQPTIQGVSTSTAAFVGTSKRGPADELGFVTSFREFEALYGTDYPDSFLEDAVFLFFQNGGRRAYISRVLGTGAVKASGSLPALAGAASAAQIDGTGIAPFDIEPSNTITIVVDGGAPQVFTFLATRAIRAGSGLAITDLTADTLLIRINGGAVQTITFAGTDTTAALVAAKINSQLVGGSANVNGAEVDIQSDTRGTGSSVQITGGTALTEIGHTVGTTTGTGNVVNIDAVTIAEVLALLSTLTGAVASNNGGALRITHSTAGVLFTLAVTTAPTALGMPAGTFAGTASSPVNIATIFARNEGAWGNTVAVTTERWRTTTTAILSTGATEITLTSVEKAEIGDVVKITDGVTTVIVHVRAVDVALKKIFFDAITIASPIATAAVANTASSHRARTTLAVAVLSGATKITVTSASQFRVGTELSIDNGTVTLFRVVTNVNGNELTLNAALTAAFAVTNPVVTQHFDLTVYVDNAFDRKHSFLSMQDTDEQDWIEKRLLGDANESLQVTADDLNPVIGSPIQDRPAPVVGTLLTGGANGAAPTDSNYIGVTSPTPTGLQQVGALNQGDVNIVAIPGISSITVQQALSDFADLKANMVALVDPPLSMEEPVEIRDWRQNQHNRDTSYSALYYPWLEIRDRHASSTNARKSVPPSGAIAGLYARVDQEVGPWEAPGNRILREVIQPIVRVSDGQQDILNPIGINVIRTFPGEGTRVWGIRTLSNTLDGRHYVHIRRLLNFVKISLAIALRRFIFAGIQPELFATVKRAVQSFLRLIWLQGGLFPSDDFGQAQYVKCDEENNPKETRQQGIFNIECGINPPFPAEFIVLTVGLFDGETTVSEAVA